MGSNGWGTHELWLVLLFKANEHFYFNALAYFKDFFASIYICAVLLSKVVYFGAFFYIFHVGGSGFWRAGLYCDWCCPNEASQGLAGLGCIFTMEEEKKVKARAAVTKFRDKKKREEEENMARRERLKKENEDILRRTAVHQQVNTSSTSNIVWGLRQKLWQWPKNCNKVLKCLQNLSELGCFGW